MHILIDDHLKDYIKVYFKYLMGMQLEMILPT